MKPTPKPYPKFSFLYEDINCAVINKPAGILVHPLEGHEEEPNIASWWASQKEVVNNGWTSKERVGIVHRLDKDTSGALLLAKTPKALWFLQKQFHDRKVTKKYWAVVYGRPPQESGQIKSQISLDIRNRTKRQSSLINFGGTESKIAASHYKVLGTVDYKKNDVTLLEFQILTGRTHQVRLHAKMLGCPILGDYDYNIKPSKRLSKELNVARQMLHARELTFRSPEGKSIDIVAPLAEDIKKLLANIGIEYSP